MTMALSSHSIVSLEDTKISLESCVCLTYSEGPGLLDNIVDGETVSWPPDPVFLWQHNMKDWWDAKAVGLWCQGNPAWLPCTTATDLPCGWRSRKSAHGCLLGPASQWDCAAAPAASPVLCHPDLESNEKMGRYWLNVFTTVTKKNLSLCYVLDVLTSSENTQDLLFTTCWCIIQYC